MSKIHSIAFAAILAATTTAQAQSTSPWIKVNSGNGTQVQGQLGATYVSLGLLKVSVYGKSNWWTRLIERNRSAVATVTLSGSVSGGKSIQDKRVSPPISLTKNAALVDFGWAQALLINFPVNYTSLQVDVSVAKTARDGGDDIIAVASDASTKIPLLSASSAYLGIASAAKTIVDTIFNKQLAVDKLKSSSPLTTTQPTLLPPGVYAVLAGDKASDYAGYQASLQDLTWDDSSRVLMFKGSPIDKVSYFVVDVAYRPSVFEGQAPLDSALTTDKPWARLYRSALTQAQNFSDVGKATEVRNAVAAVKADAEQLLNEDVDFVQSERASLQAAARERLTNVLHDRYTVLKLAAGSSEPEPLSLE